MNCNDEERDAYIPDEVPVRTEFPSPAAKKIIEDCLRDDNA